MTMPDTMTGGGGRLAGLGRKLSARLERARRSRADREVAARLLAMDAHLLRDIGVTPDQIDRMARGGE